MNPDATPDQADAVGRELEANPDVKDVKFVDKQQAYEEFKLLFRDSPELVDTVTPDILPPRAGWCRQHRPERDRSRSVDNSRTKAGVMTSSSRTTPSSGHEGHPADAASASSGVAVVLLVAACLLIVNTIRTAMFARRREIEVMKLVGAIELVHPRARSCSRAWSRVSSGPRWRASR